MRLRLCRAGSVLRRETNGSAWLGRYADTIRTAIDRAPEVLPSPDVPADIQVSEARYVRALIAIRRTRQSSFMSVPFSDPAWDILLDLAAAALEQRDVSVSSLCIAANVPTTTALRHIKALQDGGIIERRSDPADARRAYIAISQESLNAMLAFLALSRKQMSVALTQMR